MGALALAGCSSPEPENPEVRTWEERFRRNDSLEKQLGESITVEGVAQNQKVGPSVGALFVDGLAGWPAEVVGKNVRVTGRLIRRDDNPVFRVHSKEPPPAGIPVPEGVDLERARRRYLLAEPRWQKVED
jgi:hypothetical protein